MTTSVLPESGRTHDVLPGRVGLPRWARRWGSWSKDLLLGVAALLGLVCVGWLVYAQVTGAMLVVFRTGSMSPTMPTGAVAIAVPTPASEVAVGDVITARPDPDAQPITHRVVSIAAVPGRPDARDVVMKGDDNATPDLLPYRITSAPRVVWSHHRGAGVLAWLQSPVATWGVVAGVGLVVLWAFWPTSPAGPPGGRHVRRNDA